jgi:hypothetical protein
MVPMRRWLTSSNLVGLIFPPSFGGQIWCMTGRKATAGAEEVEFSGGKVEEGAGPRGQPVVHGGA